MKIPVAKIKRIISNDATAMSAYRRTATALGTGKKEIRMCVIGGLATAAHLRLPSEDDSQNEASIDTLPNLAKRLTKAYGLTDDNLATLQSINDNTPRLEYRRVKLIRAVEKMAASHSRAKVLAGGRK